MSQSGHLHVRIQTSASPEQVFKVMRELTSARTENLRRLSSIGVPSVGTRPPRFTIRAPASARGDTPVAWAGEVTPSATGSVIVASTNRAWAIWRAGFFITVVFVVIFWAGSRGSLDGFSLFVLCALISVAASIGWTQATHLRDRDNKNALALLEVLMTRLPDASLVESPTK